LRALGARRPGQRAGVLCLLLACVAALGCGGSSSDPTPTIDKATFVVRTDAICRQSQGRIAKAAVIAVRQGPPAGESKFDFEIGLVHSLLIPTLETEIGKIRALGVPAGGAKQIATFLAATRSALEEAEQEPQTYVQAGGHYRLGRVHFGKATKIADAYGLEGCPQG
jgi:hypothetical protein